VRQRVLSAGGIPFLAVVFAFAAFDWMMTLDPFWFSTIFGVYYFAAASSASSRSSPSSTPAARGKDLYGDFVTPEHSHNVGKLMLAFTAFWGYIGFSQFMLIWIANLPEEIPFYIVRLREAWAPIGVVLHHLPLLRAVLHAPLQEPQAQAAAAGARGGDTSCCALHRPLLAGDPHADARSPSFHWTLITAFLGVGGVAVAAAIWVARGRYTIPVKDPFLSVSLRYGSHEPPRHRHTTRPTTTASTSRRSSPWGGVAGDLRHLGHHRAPHHAQRPRQARGRGLPPSPRPSAGDEIGIVDQVEFEGDHRLRIGATPRSKRSQQLRLVGPQQDSSSHPHQPGHRGADHGRTASHER
jgi:hypothetical protein